MTGKKPIPIMNITQPTLLHVSMPSLKLLKKKMKALKNVELGTVVM